MIGLTISHYKILEKFGEGRTCDADKADELLALLENLDVPAAKIGSIGGDALTLGEAAIPLTSIREVFDIGLVNIAV